eukprot:gnl/TRDRNA2_/TRDRNA2_176047_c3_seq3.p1 gnl/TRDRNA2_/TRDRNA2_176047_c3~~gnl/TRDRNA2_/TRDRNA2_176047_c3_seq3.p1  ORF type:complete len:292 (-),score=5.71 gnl/TRDRNA2_/TRDRNA2_176047_c3_seq3:1245-2120(-)
MSAPSSLRHSTIPGGSKLYVDWLNAVPCPEDFELQNFIRVIKQYNSMTKEPQWEFYKGGAYHDFQISRWDRLTGARTGSVDCDKHVDPSYILYYLRVEAKFQGWCRVVQLSTSTRANISGKPSFNVGVEFCSRAEFQDGAALCEMQAFNMEKRTLDFYVNDHRATYVLSERPRLPLSSMLIDYGFYAVQFNDQSSFASPLNADSGAKSIQKPTPTRISTVQFQCKGGFNSNISFNGRMQFHNGVNFSNSPRACISMASYHILQRCQFNSQVQIPVLGLKSKLVLISVGAKS